MVRHPLSLLQTSDVSPQPSFGDILLVGHAVLAMNSFGLATQRPFGTLLLETSGCEKPLFNI
jgi:hypothetical protein